MNKKLLMELPKIDDMLSNGEIIKCTEKYGRSIVLESVRAAIDEKRESILSGDTNKPDVNELLERTLFLCEKSSLMNLRKVINATGTILHTNLGRARLSKNSCEAVLDVAQNYSNLEYNIETGSRGERYTSVAGLLSRLTGAPDSLVVNNNAAAVLLVLSALAKDKRVIVSRGEQVEIGGMFRVPEIMEQSGSRLVEVGTTNKTHLWDYQQAIDENSVLLKVHTSNYKIIGFTEEASLKELADLGKEHNIPLIYDLGSGNLIDLEKYGIHGEPDVKRAVSSGADIITFSGDKLLGGPQAGIILGSKKYIDIIKKHPLTRAFRIDKMTMAALEATLREYLDEDLAIKNIPVLRQIISDKESLEQKAHKLFSLFANDTKNLVCSVAQSKGTVGGGSMPGYFIDSYAIEIRSPQMTPNEMEARLREYETPVIVRIANDALIIDVLTLDESDFEYLSQCIKGLNGCNS